MIFRLFASPRSLNRVTCFLVTRGFMLRRTSFSCCLLLGLLCAAPVFGQTLYSYVDEAGVRILTNIPPKGGVRDLKLTGPPPAPPAPQTTGAESRDRRYDPIIE